MAYGRLAKPKFYIDALSLASSLGEVDYNHSSEASLMRMFHLNPSGSGTEITPGVSGDTPETVSIAFGDHSTDNIEGSKWIPSITWIGVLGTDMDNLSPSGTDLRLIFKAGFTISNGDSFTDTTLSTSAINSEYYGINSVLQNWFSIGRGYSLFEIDTSPWINSAASNYTRFSVEINNYNANENTLKFGSIAAGWSWSPSFNPDIGITEEYSMEGTRTQRTLGGKDITRIDYVGSPPWVGGLRPFQRSDRTDLGNGAGNNTSLNFRKRWSMNFSFIDDTKMKPDFNFDHATWGGTAPFTYIPSSSTSDLNGYYDKIQDNFISKVWFGTMGGKLPFVFQPNSEVEEFHVVRFIQESVSFENVAHNTISVEFELEEVW